MFSFDPSFFKPYLNVQSSSLFVQDINDFPRSLPQIAVQRLNGNVVKKLFRLLQRNTSEWRSSFVLL